MDLGLVPDNCSSPKPRVSRKYLPEHHPPSIRSHVSAVNWSSRTLRQDKLSSRDRCSSNHATSSGVFTTTMRQSHASSSMLDQRKMTDREPDTTRELRTLPFYKRLRIPAVETFEIAVCNNRNRRLPISLGMAPTLSHPHLPEKRRPSPSVL